MKRKKQMKKVSFCCPHHGVINGKVEYCILNLKHKKIVDIPIMLCEECKKYYTPFVNLLSFTKLKYKGRQIEATEPHVEKSFPKVEVRTPYSIDDNKNDELENSNNQFKRTQIKDVIWKAVTDIRTIENNVDYCPVCHGRLAKHETWIPDSPMYCIRIPGMYCKSCKVLYVTCYKDVFQILCDNPHAKKYTLDRKELWNHTEIIKKKADIKKWQSKQRKQLEVLNNKMARIESAAVGIVASFENNVVKYFVIVNKKETEKIEEEILHYSNDFAREILTASLREERNKEGQWEQKKFNIHFVEEGYNYLRFPGKIVLKENGGLYSFKKYSIKREEIIDCLIYSPFTKKYEIMCATYDYENSELYVDSSIFREFVRKYGKPEIEVEYHTSSYFDNSRLKEESLLKIYGYNVSQSEELGERKRREILCELVDLEMIEISRIVRLLDFFISSHPNEKDWHAREKWCADKKFIINYRIMPERFLIPQNDILKR